MIIHPLRSALAAIVVALATPAAADAWRVKPAQVIDHNGFGGPVVAATVMVPHDWRVEGGVFWNANAACRTDGVQLRWSATDPTGRAAFAILPSMAWEANDMYAQYGIKPACISAAFTSVQEFLDFFVRTQRPGAQVLQFRRRPDLEARQPRLPGFPDLPGMRTEMRREIGEVLIGYTHNGVNYREILRTGVMAVLTAMEMPGMGVTRYMFGVSDPMMSLRAPDGVLDFRFYDFVQASIRPDPNWSARMAEHNARMARIDAKGANDRARIRRESNAEIARINSEGYEARQRVQDEGVARFNRTMREVELYNDPQSGVQVELPSTYDNAWRLDDGSYLVADQGIDPNAYGIGATQLTPAR